MSLSATLEGVIDGKSGTFEASAKTQSRSRLSLLLEGFKIVRERKALAQRQTASVQVNGRQMACAPLVSSSGIWVDGLIERWLGGFRRDEYICWDIGDGYTYCYNPITNELGREVNGQPSPTTR